MNFLTKMFLLLLGLALIVLPIWAIIHSTKDIGNSKTAFDDSVKVFFLLILIVMSFFIVLLGTCIFVAGVAG